MNKKPLIDDDELYNSILNRLPYIDEGILLNVKNELVENNEDIECIDEIIENNKFKSVQKTTNKKRSINFFQLFNIFNKKDKIQENNNDYEDYQLEEQELEEDDFHYEDLD